MPEDHGGRRSEAVAGSVLGRIGGTPLVELSRLVPPDHARVLLKLESDNPTGSMKDRMGLAMVEAAERDGRLPPGGTVVEYTGGSTGVSLALVCAVKGYRLEIATSDAFSIEKRNHMRAFGARLTTIKSERGGMSEALTRSMIEAARRICEDSGGFWTDQLNNRDQFPAYEAMGEEIWRQTGGRIDAFVHSVGTSASLLGAAAALRRRDPDISIVAVEPAESAVLSGAPTGVHRVEGIGAGFVVPLWDPDAVDEIETVSTREGMAMARRLAETEGLFAGTSTGVNLVAALRLAKRLGPAATVVTLMVDSGIKYLSTELYRGE